MSGPGVAIVSAALDVRAGTVAATIAVSGIAARAEVALAFGTAAATIAVEPAAGGIALAAVTMPAGEPQHPWPALEARLGTACAVAPVTDGTTPVIGISRASLIRETGALDAIGLVYGRRPGDALIASIDGAAIGAPEPMARPDVHATAPWLRDGQPGWRIAADVAPVAGRDAMLSVALVRGGRTIAAVTRALPDPGAAAPARGWALVPLGGGGTPDFDRLARAMIPATRRRLLASRAFQRQWSRGDGHVARRLRRAIVETMVARGEAVGPLAIRLSTGALVEADPAVDEVIARRFLLDGIYEQGLIDWMTGFLRPGDGVIDVGACYGHVALAAAKAVGRSGRVAAIEANPGTARILRRDLALNPALRVEVVETAVGDRAGSVRFMAVDTNLGGSRLAAAQDDLASARALIGTLTTVSLEPGSLGRATHSRAALSEVEVAMRMLDDVVAELGFAPRLMKMDIEGAELLALRGAAGLLAGRFGPPPWIVLEYSALFPMLGGRREDVFDLLTAAGYRAWKMAGGKTSGGALVAVPTAADAPHHDDLIFAPPD